MSRPDTLPRPPETGLPPIAQWPCLLRFSIKAIAQMVHARIEFNAITVPEIQRRNAALKDLPPADEHAPLPGWIAYTIPRIARRLPFRSDCLVQAMAAQAWLAQHGIASEILIGAERGDGKPFAAHAWLKSGLRIITGGNIAQYTVLI